LREKSFLDAGIPMREKEDKDLIVSSGQRHLLVMAELSSGQFIREA
jgi:hypothetical protein